MGLRGFLTLLAILILILIPAVSLATDFNLSVDDSSPHSRERSVKSDVALNKALQLFYMGDFSKSYELLDLVDRKYNLMKKKETILSAFLKNFIQTLANDSVVSYTPWIYEMVSVNTFKGIDSLFLGRENHAGVEFNRALVRELEAEDAFRKEIEKQEKAIQQEYSSSQNSDVFRRENLEKTVSYILEKYYSNLNQFRAYRGFLNPFTDYISGIYFLALGNYEKATDLLKRSYGLVRNREPGSHFIAEDFKLSFERMQQVTPGKVKRLWIVVFNGQIGQRVEKRIDVPLFLVTEKVLYTGLALPDIKPGTRAVPFVAYSIGNRKGRTERIVDMDLLEKIEFKKRFQAIALRAVVRALIFTLGQLETKKTAKKVIAGYHFIMNRADTRQWRNLPKEVQIASVDLTNFSEKKAILTLRNPQSQEEKLISINTEKSTLIVVSCPDENTFEVFKRELN